MGDPGSLLEPLIPALRRYAFALVPFGVFVLLLFLAQPTAAQKSAAA